MNFTPLECMETPTLLLRPLTPDDAPALFEQMLSDLNSVRDLPIMRHTELEHTARFIEESLKGWERGTLLRYVLECRETGAHTALVELKPALPRIELGVLISRVGGARRRRAGILALRQLIDWLLEQPGVYRLFATCAVDGRAYSSMERLGFTREATLVNYEAWPNRDVIAGDSYLYARTRPAPKRSAAEEWARSTWLKALADDS